jgi:hypothetical protein
VENIHQRAGAPGRLRTSYRGAQRIVCSSAAVAQGEALLRRKAGSSRIREPPSTRCTDRDELQSRRSPRVLE